MTGLKSNYYALLTCILSDCSIDEALRHMKIKSKRKVKPKSVREAEVKTGLRRGAIDAAS